MGPSQSSLRCLTAPDRLLITLYHLLTILQPIYMSNPSLTYLTISLTLTRTLTLTLSLSLSLTLTLTLSLPELLWLTRSCTNPIPNPSLTLSLTLP